MPTTRALLDQLQTYHVKRLEPLVVMSTLNDAAQALLSKTDASNLKSFSDAQSTAGGLIDELQHGNPRQCERVTREILRVSEAVFRHLRGESVLGNKPLEDEKEAFLRWAICTRHVAESAKNLAA